MPSHSPTPSQRDVRYLSCYCWLVYILGLSLQLVPSRLINFERGSQRESGADLRRAGLSHYAMQRVRRAITFGGRPVRRVSIRAPRRRLN